MTDANKTKAQLIAELQEARRRVAELERAEIHPDSTREGELKPTEPFLQIQRDLGLALSSAASLAETYKICVDTAIQASGMDSGGIYLVEKTGELNLAYHQGLSTEFIQQVAHYEADAPHVKMVLAGQPVYVNYPEFTGTLGLNRIEHLKVLAVIPISLKHQIIAVFNIASHTRTEIPESSRVILEAIASQIGEAILRAQKERELELSQKQLRAMFDAVEDFLFIVDATGHILDINPTVITRLGRSRAELIGQPVFCVHPPEQQEQAIAFIHEMLAGRRNTCFIPLAAANGKLIPVETRVFRNTWENQEVLVEICRDVSARNQAEAAYKNLVEGSIQGFAIFQDGGMVFVNETVCNVLGFSREELLAFSTEQMLTLIHPDDREWVTRDLFDRMAGRYVPEHQMLQIVRKEGAVRWVEIFVSNIEYQSNPALQIAFIDITERKLAETALRESEERFKKLSNLTFEGIIFHQNGVILDANESVARIFGYSLAELLGKNIIQLCVLPEYHLKIKENIVKKVAKPYEVRVRRKDGSVLPVEIEARDVKIQGDEYRVAAIRDITERKQAEEAIHRSQSLLNESQHLSHLGGWEWNLQNQAMFWTDETYLIHGFTRDEIEPGAAKHIECSAECYDPPDRRVIMAAFTKCAETGEPYDLEVPFTSVQGHRKWVRTTAKAEIENGQIVKVIGNIMDITERKQIEIALKGSELLLQTVMDAIPACIYVKDIHGKYLFVNQFITNLYGSTPTEMLGKTDLDFAEKLSLTQAEALAFIRHDHEVIQKHQSKFVNEEPFTLPDGSQRWFQTRKLPISLPDQPNCMLGVSEDITERKRTEDKLRESEASLARAQRISHLGNWLWDAKGQSLVWSAELYEIFGIDPQFELSYEAIVAYVHPDDRELNQQFVTDLFATAQSAQIEFRVLRTDGAERHIFQSAEVQRDSAGNVIRIFGIMLDVTELKQTEIQLRESEQKYKAVVENIGLGVALISPKMEILTLNHQMQHWFPGTDLSKKTLCFQAFNNPPRTEICAYCPTCKTLQDGLIHEAATEMPVDHKIINFRIVSTPIKDAAGKVIAAIEMVEDITERKRAEDLLRSSEEKYRLLFENMAQGVFYQAVDGTLLDVNATALEIFGLSRAEFLGRTSDAPEWCVINENGSRLPGEQHPSMVALRTKQPVQNTTFGIYNPRRAEYIWVSLNATPMFRAGESTPYQVFVTLHDITARKRAEDALRESEERYRLLLEAIQDSIYVLDREWRHTLVNAGATAFTQIPREQLLGNKLADLFPGVENTSFFKIFQKVMDSRTPDSVLAEFIFKDGRKGWFDVHVYPVPEGIICISRDISQRKLAEEALLESQERYQTLFEDSPIAIWEEDFSAVKTRFDQLRQAGVTDFRDYWTDHPDEIPQLAGLIKLEELNQAGIDLLGATDKKQVIRDLPTYFIEDSLKVFSEELIALAAGQLRFHSEIPILNCLGELKLLDLSLVVAPGSEETLSQVIVSFVDITARKRAEDALRLSEAKLRLMFTNIHDVFFSVDRNGILTEISPSVEKILGYEPEEMTGKFFKSLNIFTPESNARVLSDVQKLLSGEILEMAEYEFVSRDGTVRFGEVSGSPIVVNLEVIGFASVARDVTARKRAETEKVRLEEQLRRSQKLETIGTLAGGIAHDFNNILTPIMGYAELSLSSLPPADPIVEDLEQILIAANRARDLVEQILIFSRQLEKERKPLSLHLIVKEALKLLRPAIPTTVEIRQHIDSSGDKVLADAAQMHQILVNLCTNAWQSMETKGGTLTIELQQVEVNAATAQIHPNLLPAKYAWLSVIDTGIGMDAATLDRIFEPFFTTKAVGKGTGMGLAVVHGIVRSHHGEIMVDSKPGKGTVFHVYIPTVTAEAMVEPAEIQPMPRGHESILIVDDEAAVGNMVQKLLDRLGYTVEFYQSSFEALKAFRQQPDRFDLVISDLTMPNLTGLELTRQFHRTRADLPVILMTGYGEVVSGEIQKQYGIQWVLRKPISLHEFANLIRKILDKA